jgi:arylsulfatase A-like enzyme
LKRIIQIIFGFVYLAALIFSLVVQIKPGSSFFYNKSQIQTQNLIQDGNAYDYQFNVNTHIYDPGTILFLEDQKGLFLSTLGSINNGDKGSFALKDIGAGQITIQFVPTTLSNPATNGHTYRIYIRPYLLSSNWGSILFLIMLLLVLISFKLLRPSNPQKREEPLVDPSTAVKNWSGLWAIAAGKAKSYTKPPLSLLVQAVVNIVLLAFLYIFMEWLFFVTKSSFMDMLGTGEKIKILLITGLAAALLFFLTLPVMFLLDVILTPFFSSFRKYVFYIPAAFLASCLCLILIDNFTYTIFNFGIVSSKTLIRDLYAIAFAGMFIYILRKMAAATKPDLKPGIYRLNYIAAVILFALSCILAGFTFKPQQSDLSQSGHNSNIKSKPNILLLGTDGLNAKSMSAYGYERETTPFIDELAKTSLLSENNFTNAYVSMGSDTSTLTSKLPFTTHVLNPPDTLKGEGEFQSLPGLLKMNGYRTVSLGVPYFVDANTINFQNAFNDVNCQENPPDLPLSASSYGNEIYLMTTIEGRIGDRLKHIFFIQNMQDIMLAVKQADSEKITDVQRLDCLHSYLDHAKQTDQPLFAHIHLMGTHGFSFDPTHQVFSKGEKQNGNWMTDFYDDSILDFDTQVQELVQYLKNNDQWNNTILILYTDHGEKWTTRYRIPLIIHFPKDQHTGTISENTQNIDIAPTMLDYLGIQIPDWMEGSSLFRKLDANRLIIAGFKYQAENEISTVIPKPPFYQFSHVSVIQCQNWYNFDLEDKSLTSGVVVSYVNPCSANTLDSQEVIRGKVSQVLIKLGYSLPYW